MIQQSVGHIAFVGTVEYYELEGQVYRAPLDAVFDVRTGARIGRWECSREHFDRFREVILG